MKRSPVLGAATGLALSSVTLIGVATPANVSAIAPPISASTATPSPQAAESTLPPLAYAGALPTEIDRGFDRASRAKRAGQAARAQAALAKAAAARAKATNARLAAAARQRALAARLRSRVTSGVASVPELRTWAHRAVNARGWSDQQWTCLDKLWTLESSWSITEKNSSSSAYGIPQSLPGSKMASIASDWRYNGNTQILWGLGYIADRYGSPCAAWAHSRAYNFY